MVPFSTLVEVLAQLVFCHCHYGVNIEILLFLIHPFAPTLFPRDLMMVIVNFESTIYKQASKARNS